MADKTTTWSYKSAGSELMADTTDKMTTWSYKFTRPQLVAYTASVAGVTYPRTRPLALGFIGAVFLKSAIVRLFGVKETLPPIESTSTATTHVSYYNLHRKYFDAETVEYMPLRPSRWCK